VSGVTFSFRMIFRICACCSVASAGDSECAAAFGAWSVAMGHGNVDLHRWTPALASNERAVGNQTAGASLWTKIA
jgi:hypothetical protein